MIECKCSCTNKEPIVSKKDWPIGVMTYLGQEYYAQTHLKAVLDDSGRTLDTILQSIYDKLDSQILEIDATDVTDLKMLNPEIWDKWIVTNNKLIKIKSADPEVDGSIITIDRIASLPTTTESGEIINLLGYYFTAGTIDYIVYETKDIEIAKNSSCGCVYKLKRIEVVGKKHKLTFQDQEGNEYSYLLIPFSAGNGWDIGNWDEMTWD